MPTLTFVEQYAHPPAKVFAFFLCPANVLAVAPPGTEVTLIEGPDEVSAGSTYAVQLRKFGLSQRIDTEVGTVEAPALTNERQAKGPFRHFTLTRKFAATAEGTVLTETIDFEPPGGMLGLMLNAAVIERELRQSYEGRAERVSQRLTAD